MKAFIENGTLILVADSSEECEELDRWRDEATIPIDIGKLHGHYYPARKIYVEEGAWLKNAKDN